MKSFPTVSHSLTRIPEAVISATGNDDDRQPKNEAYKKATAAMDYAPQGGHSDHTSFCTHSVGYVTDQCSDYASQRVINVKCVIQNKHIQPPLSYSPTQQTNSVKEKHEGTFHGK